MPKVDIPVAVLKAIDALVAYDWATEENDYELCGQEGNNQEGHIFLTLRRIDNWLSTAAVQEILAREETS